MSVEDLWKGLTPEQQEKAKNAKGPEEILAFARDEGYELTDEQLESVAGGWSPKSS